MIGKQPKPDCAAKKRDRFQFVAGQSDRNIRRTSGEDTAGSHFLEIDVGNVRPHRECSARSIRKAEGPGSANAVIVYAEGKRERSCARELPRTTLDQPIDKGVSGERYRISYGDSHGDMPLESLHSVPALSYRINLRLREWKND